MKRYEIRKHSGNMNKWNDDYVVQGETTISQEVADDFNRRVDTTGVEYVAIAERETEQEQDVQTDPNTGHKVDLSHAGQKEGTATELDHGTIEANTEDGIAATDNATALQDDTVPNPDDKQINSSINPDEQADTNRKLETENEGQPVSQAAKKK